MKARKSFLALATILATSPVFGAEFVIDGAHTNVGFTIKHLVSRVSGGFKKFEGSFTFDAKKPAGSKVRFVIDAASIDTDNEKRDEHLRSPDFFNVETHKQLTFDSKSFKPAGKNKYKLTGDLTMNGVTKPVTFDVEYLGTEKDPWGNTKVGFVADAKIKRKDFGIVWNKTLDSGGFVLGEDVDLKLQIEANEKKAEEAKK